MLEEKKSSPALKFELFEIQKAVEEIRDSVATLKPKSKMRQLLDAFLNGIFKGLGFVIGTTILAGLFFLLIKYLLTQTGFELWLNDQIQQILTNAIGQVIMFTE